MSQTHGASAASDAVSTNGGGPKMNEPHAARYVQ